MNKSQMIYKSHRYEFYLNIYFYNILLFYLENIKTLSKLLKTVIRYPSFDDMPKNFCPISNP